MNNAPTIVRLLHFPESIRLGRKGDQFVGPLRRSGLLVLSEREGPIDVTFRLPLPGFSFLTGGTAFTVTEVFNEGEQRDVLAPWQLVVDANHRAETLVFEIDIAYTGTSDVHTATVPIELEYGVSRRKAAVAAGTALAAAAVAVVAASRRRSTIVADDDQDVELSLFNFAPTSKTTSPRVTPKGAKITVRDADQADVAVLNVGRAPSRPGKTKARPAAKRSSAKKKAPAKKTASKKVTSKKSAARQTASKKASAKKAPAKKATSKKAPARKAGGTRRGSPSSRSTQRTGARGSSAARKSAARRSTRKSR
jgi:hypothetical protein